MIRSLMRAGNARGAASYGGLVTTPSFHAAGTYAEIASGGGSAAPSLPANNAGDLFLAVGVAYLSTASAPAGWTQQAGPDTGGSQNSYVWTRDTRASGGESGTPSFPLSDRGGVRIYSFSDVATSGFFEALASTATGASPRTNPTVGPLSDHRLACLACAGYSTSAPSAAVAVGTAATGGTWAEVAEAEGTLDIFFHELQTAAMAAGGTISGGTTTVTGTNQCHLFGFALCGI